MINKKINIEINASLLKIVGVLVVLVGLYGFTRGIHVDKYVSESLMLIMTGAGMLGYRKYLVSKNNTPK